MNTTATATGDLSAVTTLTDEQLAAEIALADTRFARVRINDPRRVTLAYSDAKLAVTIFTAERRRREEAAAIAAAEAIVAEAAAHICPPSCKGALSHPSLCECRCRGEFHGAEHRDAITAAVSAYQERAQRAGGAMGLLASMGGLADDDEPW